jgi:hypothetical protein
MNDDLDNIVLDMFDQYGLKMIENNSIFWFHGIPNLNVLKNIYSIFEENSYEEKTDIIKKYLSKKNHFRITSWEFFFPYLKVNQLEEKQLKHFFNFFKIDLYEGNLRITFTKIMKYELMTILENKELSKKLLLGFSKELQMKGIFVNNEQTRRKFKKEIVEFILSKLTNLAFEEKLEVELPNLIMKNLYITND